MVPFFFSFIWKSDPKERNVNTILWFFIYFPIGFFFGLSQVTNMWRNPERECIPKHDHISALWFASESGEKALYRIAQHLGHLRNCLLNFYLFAFYWICALYKCFFAYLCICWISVISPLCPSIAIDHSFLDLCTGWRFLRSFKHPQCLGDDWWTFWEAACQFLLGKPYEWSFSLTIGWLINYRTHLQVIWTPVEVELVACRRTVQVQV